MSAVETSALRHDSDRENIGGHAEGGRAAVTLRLYETGLRITTLSEFLIFSIFFQGNFIS